MRGTVQVLSGLTGSIELRRIADDEIALYEALNEELQSLEAPCPTGPLLKLSLRR